VNSPNFFRPPAAEFKGSKVPRIQDLKGQLLREEAGHRTEEVERAANEARAEPDPAVAEAEAGRPGEAASGLRRELVAGTIHVQFLPTDEPFGMSENDGTDREASETELVGHEDLTSPTDGLATVTHAELGRDDQDVALLRFGDQIERVRRASVNPQLRRRDLTLTVVVERPGVGDLGVNEMDRLAVLLDRIGHFGEVLRRQCVHRGNREPSFGTVREFRQGLGEFERVARIETEDLGDRLDLVVDRLRPLVLLRVRVVGLHLLVLELVGDRQILERGDGGRADGLGEIVAVFDDALCARVVETELRENFLHGVGCEPVDLFDLTGRCGLLSNRAHCVISF